MSPPNISVIILTCDEAGNIVACLDSVSWSDDVILVDSNSSDDTTAVARARREDLRIFENPFSDFGQQRNWALDHCDPKHDWILFLDADERVTPELREQMVDAVDSGRAEVGYFLCYRNMFLGQWLKRCTFFPSWQLRLLRHGEVRYEKAGHGQREVTEGPLGFLDQPYDHFGFSKGIAAWIERHNRYSTEEAEYFSALAGQPLRIHETFSRNALVRRRAVKRLAARLPARPLVRFLYTYFFRLGFLDGSAGWTFCQLQLAHELNLSAKQRELRLSASAEAGLHHENPEGPPAAVGAGSESSVGAPGR